MITAVVGVNVLAARSSGPPPPDEVITIPLGTADRLDRGEQVEVIPAELHLAVDQQLVVRNDDDRTHLLGPIVVRAGEVLRHRFRSPGRFVAECTVHPSGSLRIIVA